MKTYTIEEKGFGKPSERCSLFVYPHADITGLAECCREMSESVPKTVWVVIDTRTPPSHAKKVLQTVSAELPNCEQIIRFAHPFIISLILHLWKGIKTP